MNNVMSFSETIEKSVHNLAREVNELFTHIDKIYSYVLHSYSHTFVVTYLISENDRFNCIDVRCARINIINAIRMRFETQGIISYEQPPLDVLIKALKPLVFTLSKKEHAHWRKQLTFEDAKQMCNLCVCELYLKGYYIHKSLISKSLRNAIYQFLRIDDHRNFKLVSLYAKQRTDIGGSSDESLMLLDKIRDEKASSLIDDNETLEVKDKILEEQKQFIIDIIGKRQYDQLVREWTMNSTTSASRKKVMQLKNEIKKLGLDANAWNKYYE